MTTTSKKLVPNIRFPEFEKSGEWVEKKLEDIVDILDNLRRPISKNNRIPGQYPYYGANGIMDYINDYIFDGTYILLGEDGSVINQDSSPVMHIAIGKFWVNNHAHVVKEKCQLYNLYFIYYALHNANIEGLVKGIPPKLNQENLKIINITIADVKEQQKIADFLSSVDELIELEQKKLEKLKEYKKGLLQNLFPKENQKVPDLRFPEFKNSGECVEKKLKEYCDIIVGGDAPEKFSKERTEQFSIPIYSNGVGEKMLYGYTNKARVFDECVTVSARGTIGYTVYHNKPFYPIVRLLCLVPNKLLCTLFLKYQLDIVNIEGTQVGISQLTAPMVSEYHILVPSLEEQQKIADFLSSVDELITEQATKLKLLYDYKKGLLQQLFPN